MPAPRASSTITITPCGAVGEVTGSGYVVQSPRATVLVDFGMFQGRPGADQANRELGPVDPSKLDAVVVTHAHLDHIGRLPVLAHAGYRGPIHLTPATAELAAIMLEDAARIQEQDAQRENRHRQPGGTRQDLPPITPLFDREDIALLEPLFQPLPLEVRRTIAPGVTVRFFEAGHILGSASVEMVIDVGRDEETGRRRDEVRGATPSLRLSVSSSPRHRTIIFSGDIGQRGSPILNDPIPPARADLIVLESTYGDRDHRSQQATIEEFHAVLKQAAWEKRRVLIPAFAVGRTQTLLYHIAAARREQVIPEFPVYLDSPLGEKATRIYAAHHELYDREAGDLAQRKVLQDQLSRLRVLQTTQESKTLNESWEPCAIIAGSGMCDGGRIVHHLRHGLWRRNVTIVLPGFMAQGTLGRRLADRAEKVFIFGDPVEVRAAIHTIGGFSAHAGQSELVEWIRPAMQHAAAEPGAAMPRIVLTHGESPQREALAARIREHYGESVRVERPMPGGVITLA